MSIEKKSLISTLKTTKKANAAAGASTRDVKAGHGAKMAGMKNVGLKKAAAKNIGLKQVGLKRAALKNIGLKQVGLKRAGFKNIGLKKAVVD